MKRFILMLLFSIACGAQAQDLQFSGYFENQFFPQALNDKIILQDYNKLRLDLSAQVSDRLSFNGNYIFQTHHGANRFNSFDLIPRRVVEAYASRLHVSVDSLRPRFDFALEDEKMLDNAYVSYYSDAVNVRIGKQQLPWGSGYAWNPTDIFHEKNLLDPTYEKRGVNAFKVERSFGGMGMVTGILGVEEDWKHTTKALKVKHHVRGFDVSVSFIEKYQHGFDYDVFQETTERRRLFGWDFSGEVKAVGIWAEGAYNTLARSRDYGQYLVGADYTFESGLYISTEYYHNGRGRSNKAAYSFNDWMRLTSTAGENLGRRYLYAGHRYPLTELLDWSTYVVINLTDGSYVVYPYVEYSLTDNTQLTLIGYVPLGKKDAEFGAFGAGGIARVRLYF